MTNITKTSANKEITVTNAIAAYSKEALWEWDFQRKQTGSHSNCQALLHYSPEQNPDFLSWRQQHLHEDDLQRIRQLMDVFLEDKTATNTSHVYRLSRGSSAEYVFIEDHCIVTRDETGKPITLAILMRDVTEQKKLQKKLEDQEDFYKRQIDLSVMDAQQNERRKLAEELHDNVNQLLGVVKLYIEHSITNDNIRDGLLKKSNQYIDKVIEELRNLSKNLAPPLLAELGLEHSLISLAESIAEVQRMNIWVEMEHFDEEGVADNHKLMIYRIVQEQLNNIIKHADAENATIYVERKDSVIYMSITDDGRGTELNSEFNNGIGLRNIKNRIELYHGKMEIESSPGKGFRLTIEFNL